jgi:hypothetical protein
MGRDLGRGTSTATTRARYLPALREAAQASGATSVVAHLPPQPALDTSRLPERQHKDRARPRSWHIYRHNPRSIPPGFPKGSTSIERDLGRGTSTAPPALDTSRLPERQHKERRDFGRGTSTAAPAVDTSRLHERQHKHRARPRSWNIHGPTRARYLPASRKAARASGATSVVAHPRPHPRSILPPSGKHKHRGGSSVGGHPRPQLPQV